MNQPTYIDIESLIDFTYTRQQVHESLLGILRKKTWHKKCLWQNNQENQTEPLPPMVLDSGKSYNGDLITRTVYKTDLLVCMSTARGSCYPRQFMTSRSSKWKLQNTKAYYFCLRISKAFQRSENYRNLEHCSLRWIKCHIVGVKLERSSVVSNC